MATTRSPALAAKEARDVKPFLTTLHGALYQEDCLAFLARMKSETVDCVFADPELPNGKVQKQH